jgi:hypothetical protein
VIAIEITATGGADVLVLHEAPEPVAGPRQAVVRVEAAGVNFIDVYVREGRYPAQLGKRRIIPHDALPAAASLSFLLPPFPPVKPTLLGIPCGLLCEK